MEFLIAFPSAVLSKEARKFGGCNRGEVDSESAQLLKRLTAASRVDNLDTDSRVPCSHKDGNDKRDDKREISIPDFLE